MPLVRHKPPKKRRAVPHRSEVLLVALSFRGDHQLSTKDTITGRYSQYGSEAGSTGNTFISTNIAQADYDMQSLAYELNVASAKCARNAADRFTKMNPAKTK